METNVERKVVCVTVEDHEYIGELYKKITESYKSDGYAGWSKKPTCAEKGEKDPRSDTS